MSKVKSISGATADQMMDLNAKAKEMGATTKFTASEAGDAFTYMAMAGWKTEDMLNGIEGICPWLRPPARAWRPPVTS